MALRDFHEHSRFVVFRQLKHKIYAMLLQHGMLVGSQIVNCCIENIVEISFGYLNTYEDIG